MKKNKNYDPEEILITFGNANISKLGGGKGIQDHIHILSSAVTKKKKKNVHGSMGSSLEGIVTKC